MQLIHHSQTLSKGIALKLRTFERGSNSPSELAISARNCLIAFSNYNRQEGQISPEAAGSRGMFFASNALHISTKSSYKVPEGCLALKSISFATNRKF